MLVSALVREPGNDEELATRQSALQAEATALLDELDQSKVFSDSGPMAVAGSYVSHLMCWRDLDVIEIYTAVLENDVRTPEQFSASSPITGCPKSELAGERFGSVASGDRFDACAWKRPCLSLS